MQFLLSQKQTQKGIDMQVQDFKPTITTPFAQAAETGLLIDVGWTVGIPKERAIDYVRKYNTNANYGFFEHNGKVCLTHGDAKLLLTKAEADALIGLVRAAYLGE